ncbi:SusC/RagA family TonB-linked outer membrane protein [Algoriphagus sp. AGSA1]|uniref:SusC/RagA family TonB-linked outer membrane protein n=1 Tax=Algoriphagus sp. AGSA1 TaxID=2907213 RepID=UPI001F467714|nr:SusC/RagA family TonB-linked outer membrane protein [Algoriphagus sp. AGSA1]MCE7056814.1 SusC/RagA family TonB-linked outer membrane protein [Algoriphagus sp. AGSA1]
MKSYSYKFRCRLVLLLGLGMILNLKAAAQNTDTIRGKVVSATDSQPIPGSTVTLKGTLRGTVSDEEGEFSLELPRGEHLVVVSFLGYKSQEIQVTVPTSTPLEVRLEEDQMNLSEVEVVSTGYQEIPKERATGSFVQVDRDLIDRRFSTNLLDRLEDVTPSLMINREGPGEGIRIRGRNTIFANTDPLIIVDNFPYDGPLENINPNDVESITILRDAAAASIWGARAGNGVIVITTKSGKTGQQTRVSLSSNVSVTESPDLFYNPVSSVEPFLSLEEQLFAGGFYAVRENNANKPALSPWVETLIAHRDGKISDDEKQRLRDQFVNSDFRDELNRHYYRPEIRSQHYLGLQGGDGSGRYAFSAGYDANQANVIGNGDERITLSAKGDWSLMKKDRLKISAGLYYTSNESTVRTEVPEAFLYERLIDDAGNPQAVIRQYSRRFTEANTLDGALDWRYIPLLEKNNMNFQNSQEEIRLNLSAGYRITDWLSVEVLYQRWRNNRTGSSLYPETSYYTRELVNRFVQEEPDGTLTFPVPLESIFDRSNTSADSYNLRSQLRFSKSIGEKGELSGLAGAEIRDWNSVTHSARYYGYEEEYGRSVVVPLATRFPSRVNNSLILIPSAGISHPGSVDRFLSQYINSAYTHDGKYTISASARRDASNFFGVNANQRGVPLWSMGMAWTISEERFYRFDWMPYLKLRSTYGYAGNINRSVTSFITANTYSGAFNALTGRPYAWITNPPNPELRWEKIGTFNLALDFASVGDRLSGSVEWYQKNGRDLFGDFPVSPSTGVSQLRGNFAETQTRGFDVQLNSKNIMGKFFSWETRFFLSTVSEKVTRYDKESSVSNLMGYFGTFPMEGRPLFAIYSYPWAGLDSDTGDPRGILDGEPSTDYREIISSATPESITFHGASRPTSFGSLMNNFSYKGFVVSFNISYRLGYYYKRSAVDYSGVFAGNIPHADFENRWLEPGDEIRTDVPSLPANTNSLRDTFYAHSEARVERADNIRLQDVRLSYNFNTTVLRLPLSRLEWFFYANNLGIIWKASDDPMDPDFRSMRPLRSLATGLRIEF